MTLTEYASRSVGEPRILVDIDITQENSQWVNAGAGVWVMNKNALYSYVDSSLLSWFTAQTISNVGSVLCDNVQLTEASTLLECSNNEGTFYWDGNNLYIYIDNGDSPYIHKILIGVVAGFSTIGFTPVGSRSFYDGRLQYVPRLSQSRDPLFFGKIRYDTCSIKLNNADGHFDQWGEDYNLYGNQVRISFGYADLDISEYEVLYTGFMENCTVSETEFEVAAADKRKQLTKEITYVSASTNALDTIVNIINDTYGIPYSPLYYDTTNWMIARNSVREITLNMQDSESAMDVIEQICVSVFGLFLITPEGKFSFKIVTPGDVAVDEIMEADIQNTFSIGYNSSEVISSTKIGYDRDWTLSGDDAYTFLTDTSQEQTIVDNYKTYQQRKFLTYLTNLSDAQNYSDTILAYAGTIKPQFEVKTSMKYFHLNIGDMVNIQINRASSSWLGLRKCEIIGKSYNFDFNSNISITFTLKIYSGEYYDRVTTDGYYRVTTDGYLRRTGA